jgi:hypothetical protein
MTAFQKNFARVTFLTDNRADLPKLKTRALILLSTPEETIAALRTFL